MPRPPIPRPLRREVLVESGYRCAIPTCRQIPIEIHHIIPWATNQEHSFENLISLCRNCHGLYERDEIDRTAMQRYKTNLSKKMVATVN